MYVRKRYESRQMEVLEASFRAEEAGNMLNMVAALGLEDDGEENLEINFDPKQASII